MSPALDAARVTYLTESMSPRVVFVCALAAGVAAAAAALAAGLAALIGLVTHVAFYGSLGTSLVSPAGHRLGAAVVAVPVAGGALVGLLARYGSKAIRGHGIPEAMEQIVFNESRIPARMMFLKPLSAALAIGTGGPFGAEGPIIATGGALGSFVGQVLRVTPDERKTLLCAGAAAGMSATFGTPVSAVLLAIELLLFEYRARAVIPVALAASIAAGSRVAFLGVEPVFPLPALGWAPSGALVAYACGGAVLGAASAAITRLVYAIEDGFERLPVPWMWRPALGGVVVGLVGVVAPRTMGVGYSNIDDALCGALAGGALLQLSALKLVSWSVALGSGTSGGTLAPLFTIGGGLGALLGAWAAGAMPSSGVDPRMAALVGMASLFAGASHATLASVVFALETTHQPAALLPLLCGATTAYLASCLLMRTSIMTEKIARRRPHA